MENLRQLENEYAKIHIWFDPNFNERLNNLGKVYDTGLGEFLNQSKEDQQINVTEITKKKKTGNSQQTEDKKSKFKAFLKSKKDDSQNKSSFSNSLS